jgi:hypothetical protein
MYRSITLAAVLVVLLILQGLFLREAFAASTGGALLQLEASRPMYMVRVIPDGV